VIIHIQRKANNILIKGICAIDDALNIFTDATSFSLVFVSQ
jgi:hypothetical protein